MGIELEMGRPQEEGWVRGAILGAGAYGTVSLAVSRSNGQLFAIKSAADFSVALENEYQILRCLDCPYIVRCLGHNYSFKNGAEVHNLFLEYMPGGSLVDLLGKFGGTLNETVIRAYTRGILRGIDYLHSQGIVHCDIKGKNILVDSNGVKLARNVQEKENKRSAIAVPLFCNVSPSDQSHGGPFAEAFQGHESRGENVPQEIDEWKAALFALSYLSRWSKHADHWPAVIGIMSFYFADAVYQSSGALLGLS